METLVVIANFANVFLLVLNSQFARDGKVLLAFLMSWLISLAQVASTRAIATTDDPVNIYFCVAIGSSLGVAASVTFYKWLKPRIMRG